MTECNKEKTFCCPHCGSSALLVYGSIAMGITLYPPEDGRPARMEKDDENLDYDVIACYQCGEILGLPEWAEDLIYNDGVAAGRYGKVRITSPTPQGSSEESLDSRSG